MFLACALQAMSFSPESPSRTLGLGLGRSWHLQNLATKGRVGSSTTTYINTQGRPKLYRGKCDRDLVLRMSTTEEDSEGGFDLKAWFNPNTRGGVIVWSIILTVVPVLVNNALVDSGMNSDDVGAYVGFAFVCLSMVGWASTYLFRVANKDMTYATQLREYENAVLEKRLEELADDEIQALLEEIEDDDVPPPAPLGKNSSINPPEEQPNRFEK